MLFPACALKDLRPPSFLILAVDSLGFDSLSCYQQEDISPAQKSGFQVFCDSGVRFHHAYTPSVLAQAVLASILTGLYPYEHGVWSNGSHFLSSQFTTLSESALTKKYRSAFFSGGGAVWRKSGLSQGFEVFDDNIPLSREYVYRPARENIQLFIKWLDQQDRQSPFFSILYFPDLLFPLPLLKKKVGDLQFLRARTRRNTLDQSLYYLVQELKKRKRWHSTYVILFGTKGGEQRQSFRQNELPPWSLFGDNTRVSLFIKGLSRIGKKAFYGNINTPVTLVDVGWTLLDLLDSSALQQKKQALQKGKLFPVMSLKKYLSAPAPSPSQGENKPAPDERPLLLESGWSLWRKSGLSRFAIRKGPYLFIYDKKPLMYNSLTDRRELNPLPLTQPRLMSLKKDFTSYFERLGVKPYSPPDPFLIEKLRIGKKLFSLKAFQSSKEVQDRLRVLIQLNPADQELMAWRAELALRSKQWRALKNLSQKNKNFYWQYVAIRNLKEKGDMTAVTGCEKLFAKVGGPAKRAVVPVGKGSSYPRKASPRASVGRVSPPTARSCDNKSLVQLYDWVSAKEESIAHKARARFFYFYLKEKRDQKIARLNQQNYLVWDTRFTAVQEPLLSDLFLHLPEHKKYLQIVKAALF